MRVEGIGDIEILGYKAAQKFSPDFCSHGAWHHHIGAAVEEGKSMNYRTFHTTIPIGRDSYAEK